MGQRLVVLMNTDPWRQANPPQSHGEVRRGRKAAKSLNALPRKTSKESVRYSYRKPTQVDGHNCDQALERTLVQELGKLAP